MLQLYKLVHQNNPLGQVRVEMVANQLVEVQVAANLIPVQLQKAGLMNKFNSVLVKLSQDKRQILWHQFLLKHLSLTKVQLKSILIGNYTYLGIWTK